MNIAENIHSERWQLENMCLIKNEEAKIVPFTLRDEQISVLEIHWLRNFLLKCRKLGLSTLEVLRALMRCQYYRDPQGKNGNYFAAIIDITLGDAVSKLDIARLAWKHGPKHPNPRIAALWWDLHKHNPLVKDNEQEMRWANGSKIEVGTSFRGGTPQQAHISELGKIAAESAEKAKEIVTGTMNAVPTSGRITIETTHEQGRWGECYRMAKLAMDTAKLGKPSQLNWHFHFFPWMNHPSYWVEEDVEITAELEEYFARIEGETGFAIARQRRNWYATKFKEQSFAMFREYPSTVDEAFMSQSEGVIYPMMTQLRAKGRITSLELTEDPLFVFCDIGISDFMAAWCMQFAGAQRLFHGHYEEEGATAPALARRIANWQDQFGRRIGKVFLPHDGNRRAPGDGKTFADHFKAALVANGVHAPVVVVPQTKDVWVGINAVRSKILPNAWFDSRCDVPRKNGDIEYPSGVGCIEHYHKQKPGASGSIREEPAHDIFSHTADALRNCGEAFDLGLCDPTSNFSNGSTTGERDYDYAGRSGRWGGMGV